MACRAQPERGYDAPSRRDVRVPFGGLRSPSQVGFRCVLGLERTVAAPTAKLRPAGLAGGLKTDHYRQRRSVRWAHEAVELSCEASDLPGRSEFGSPNLPSKSCPGMLGRLPVRPPARSDRLREKRPRLQLDRRPARALLACAASPGRRSAMDIVYLTIPEKAAAYGYFNR